MGVVGEARQLSAYADEPDTPDSHTYRRTQIRIHIAAESEKHISHANEITRTQKRKRRGEDVSSGPPLVVKPSQLPTRPRLIDLMSGRSACAGVVRFCILRICRSALTHRNGFVCFSMRLCIGLRCQNNMQELHPYRFAISCIVGWATFCFSPGPNL